MTHESYVKPGKTSSNGSSCCKPCPDCGCLECLCRPRFFSGHLLTDEDLNRLDHYIVEKNKLHNRFLHGWGVVCGLEVLCHPCDGFVSLRAGYALSPCGEDIIVCKDERVDICSLLDRCKEKPHEDCEQPRKPASDDCKEGVQEWVLAIRYSEKPSRGVMALRGSTAPPCCSRCNCGGASSCGCGCHEGAVVAAGARATKGAMMTASSAAYRTFQRTGLNQCEPSVICEGYEFDLYRAPVRDADSTPSRGAMFERFERCIRGLLELEPPLPQAQNQLREWCCQLKENWLDFFRDHPLHDCLVADRLAALQCPEPTSNQTPAQYRLAMLTQLAPLLAEFIRSCLCSSLLPPCPCPVDDNRVPLATITIRKHDCKILRVCNWGPRKFVVTFPNLAYWFSFIPFGRTLRQLIERLCCRPFRRVSDNDFRPGTVPIKRFNMWRSATAKVDESQDFSRLVYNAFATKGVAVDAQTLFLGAMELEDANGRPILADAEVRNPLQYLLLNQLLVPAARGLVPDESRTTLRALAANALRFVRQPVEAGEELTVLTRQIDDLKKTVRKQQRKLDELNARLPDR